MATVFCCGNLGQAISGAQKANVTLKGIVLVSDCAARCTTGDPSRYSDYALLSGPTSYLLYGDTTELQKFARQRVRVTGFLEQEPIVAYGVHLLVRRIRVQTIEGDEISEGEIERLVEQLKVVPWRGVENHTIPISWDFGFTAPMQSILQAGRAAQHVLLSHLRDDDIRDQLVLLLGGVGDENAVWPIIEAMADGDQARFDPKAKRLNLIANIVLTNLTVSDVIWHHGGGIPQDRCPDDPKSCWSQWWFEHRDAFRAGVGGDRRYSNYPNYGIYMQFDGRFDHIQ